MLLLTTDIMSGKIYTTHNTSYGTVKTRDASISLFKSQYRYPHPDFAYGLTPNIDLIQLLD